MEFFVFASFIGTLILLSTHVVDYAAETLRRPPALRPQSAGEALAVKAIIRSELADEYDRAA